MKLAVSFTNLGPYHRARLRALAGALARSGDRVIAYETASREAKYAWRRDEPAEPFSRVALRPGAVLEALSRGECQSAMSAALDRDRPEAIAVAGYVRPECLAALRWARTEGRPAILMSESGALDRPRRWWKEAVKSRRVRRFDAALVGGPRHRDYLVELGMPANRIVLGYNAVDNTAFAARARRAATDSFHPPHRSARPYFLAVARFVPEKNLAALLRAFAQYRRRADADSAWDLVLCGDGPEASSLAALVGELGLSSAVHRPGFLQEDELAPWHARAGAFVLPSLSEPWGLVVNEAASCGLPLLVSDRAGCVETLVPEPEGSTGWRFDPRNETAMAAALERMARCTNEQRGRMGRRAEAVVASWGPERFASGLLEALRLAQERRGSPVGRISQGERRSQRDRRTFSLSGSREAGGPPPVDSCARHAGVARRADVSRPGPLVPQPLGPPVSGDQSQRVPLPAGGESGDA